jgi:hypothetical protein
MLYFSETDWTLPDMMAVSDEFDLIYDQATYEKKIARLIKRTAKQARKKSAEQYDTWWSAVDLVNREDHYILVLIRRAGLRPRGDLLRLWISGTAIVTLFLAAFFFVDSCKFRIQRYLPSRDNLVLAFLATALVSAIVYQVFRFTVGAEKVDNLIASLFSQQARHKVFVWILAIIVLLIIFVIDQVLNPDSAPLT